MMNHSSPATRHSSLHLQVALACLQMLVCWGLYLRTSSATLALMDGVEFTLATHFLGLPHPSCYPLFVLWAKLFEMLPFANPGARTSWASAAASAGSIGVAFALLQRLGIGSAASVLGSLGVGLAGLFWSQATASEVYSLHFWLLLLLLFFLAPAKENGHRLPLRNLFAAAFLMGLALSNHHATLVALPVLGLYLLWRGGRTLFTGKSLGGSAALLILGLSVYLFLPLRTVAYSPVLHGQPDTWTGFQEVVFKRISASSKDLAVNREENLRLHARRLWRSLPSQWAVLQALLVLAGLFLALRRRFPEALAIGGVGAMLTLMAMWTFYSRVEDITYMVDPFLTPAFLFGGLFAGWGWQGLIQRAGRRWFAVVFLLGAGSLGVLLLKNFYFTGHRDDRVAREWCWNMLKDQPRQGLLLVSVDEYFPLLYCQMIEGLRRDVKVIHRISLEEHPGDWWKRLPEDLRVYYGLQGQAPRGEDPFIYKRAIGAYWAWEHTPRPFSLSRFHSSLIPDQTTPVLQGISYRLAPRGTDARQPSAEAVQRTWRTLRWESALNPIAYSGEAERQFTGTEVVAANNTASYLLQVLGRPDLAAPLLDLSERLAPGNEAAAKLRIR